MQRAFCDCCATDFDVVCFDAIIHTEKVWLCSLVCYDRLQRVWSPKKTSVVRTTRKTQTTRPYRPGRTDSKDTTLVPCNCGVWHTMYSLEHFVCSIPDFLPAYLLSLGLSLLTLFAYSVVSAG